MKSIILTIMILLSVDYASAKNLHRSNADNLRASNTTLDCDRSCDDRSYKSECVVTLSNKYSQVSGDFLDSCKNINNPFALDCVKELTGKYSSLASAMVLSCGHVSNFFALQAVMAAVDTYNTIYPPIIYQAGRITCQAQADCFVSLVHRYNGTIQAPVLNACF